MSAGGAPARQRKQRSDITTEADPTRFAHVTDWVFDLDNTLYPHHSNLFSQIDVKMTAYVSELLKLPREEARKLQKELYLEYGTTLNGLMNRHGINPDDFLEKVHDIDYSWLKPDPVLGAAIRQLPDASPSSPTAIAAMPRRRRGNSASSTTSMISSTSSLPG